MSPPLPPLPPPYDREPAMLAWRLDLHEQRIQDLEKRPQIPSLATPMVGRYLLAGALLLVGAYGHLPWATAAGLKLFGG